MITSGTRKTAAEIIALIKETAIAKAASQQTGFSPVMQQLVEAHRASIKDSDVKSMMIPMKCFEYLREISVMGLQTVGLRMRRKERDRVLYILIQEA